MVRTVGTNTSINCPVHEKCSEQHQEIPRKFPIFTWNLIHHKTMHITFIQTGGTIDKLESIAGFRADLSEQEFLDQLGRIGVAISGQTPDLAPADGVLYGLRNATATTGSLPLIASSIMSKKIAAGADAVLLKGCLPEVLQDAILAR